MTAKYKFVAYFSCQSFTIISGHSAFIFFQCNCAFYLSKGLVDGSLDEPMVSPFIQEDVSNVVINVPIFSYLCHTFPFFLIFILVF